MQNDSSKTLRIPSVIPDSDPPAGRQGIQRIPTFTGTTRVAWIPASTE